MLMPMPLSLVELETAYKMVKQELNEKSPLVAAGEISPVSPDWDKRKLVIRLVT